MQITNDDLYSILDAIVPEQYQPGDVSQKDIMERYDVLDHTAEKMMIQAVEAGGVRRIKVKLPSGQMGWVLRKVNKD